MNALTQLSQADPVRRLVRGRHSLHEPNGRYPPPQGQQAVRWRGPDARIVGTLQPLVTPRMMKDGSDLVICA